jgi:hypothetical protein
MWDLSWTQWHWDRFSSEFFLFPYSSASSHHGSPRSNITWGMNNVPVDNRSSKTWSHPIDMNSKKSSNFFSKFFSLTVFIIVVFVKFDSLWTRKYMPWFRRKAVSLYSRLNPRGLTTKKINIYIFTRYRDNLESYRDCLFLTVFK